MSKRTPPLDDDTLERRTLEALSRAAPSVAPPGGLRERVLARVREEARTAPRDLVTLRAGEGTWVALGPGLEARELSADPLAGTRSLLVRLAPGAEIPTHDHPVSEECLVLEGELTIGTLELRAGDYHLAPAGVSHARITTRTGALAYLRGGFPRLERG